jgi:hypothetical protein
MKWVILKSGAKLHITRIASLVLLYLLGSVPAFPYSTYSDLTSNGQYIFGYGVTDVTDYQYTHYASVQVVLQSPNGRTNSTYITQTNSVSGDIYLSWDDGDLGNYVVTTTHWGYCTFMGGYFINGVTTTESGQMGWSRTGYNYIDNGGNSCKYERKDPCNVRCYQPAGYTYTSGHLSNWPNCWTRYSAYEKFVWTSSGYNCVGTVLHLGTMGTAQQCAEIYQSPTTDIGAP